MMKSVLWVGVCVSMAAAGMAHAQQSAGEVLQRAIEAARGVQSLEMKADVKGDGGFAGLLPAGEAMVRMVRVREDGDVLYDAAVSGVIKAKADGEGDPTRVLTHRTDAMTVNVDYEDKVVQELSGRLAATSSESLDLYVTPWELATPTPYDREMNADSVEYVGEDTVNGETVDVLRFEYPERKRQPGQGRTPLDSFRNATWSFGREDGLPRRVVRDAGQGGLSFSLVVEFSQVRTNSGLTAESLRIATPEGFERRELAQRAQTPSRPSRDRRIGQRPVERPGGRPAAATPTPPAVAAFDPAPDFELATVDGEVVTKSTLAGEVSVFYFWGTWCVPCRQFSPLVSDLVATFEGEPVGVYGLAVRERNAEAPAAYIEEKGYRHTLLLGSPESGRVGADAAARSFRVRVYPSIAVVGAEGELVAFERAGGGKTPQQVVKTIEDAVRSYLTDHADKLDG